MAGANKAPPPKNEMLVPLTIDIPDDEIEELIENAKTNTKDEEDFFDYVLEYIGEDVRFNLLYNKLHLNRCDIISVIKDFMGE